MYRQVTGWDHAQCAATYMYYQAVTPDERFLVFASDYSGQFELYRFELSSGETIQLTSRRQSGTSNPKDLIRSHVTDNREVYFVDGPDLMAVDLETFETRCVASPPPRAGYTGFQATPTTTGDGKSVLCRFQRRDGCQGVTRAPVDGSNEHQELFTLDDPDLQVGHVSCAPGGPLTIAVNVLPDRQNSSHEPHYRRARCWGYREGDAELYNLLTVPVGHRATHETWGPDRRLYYHRKTVPNWMPTSIESVAEDGTDRQVHFTSEDRPLGHSCVSPDGRWLVSDVQDQKENELLLIELATGQCQTVCWPNSRVLDGVTGHVHPTFSPGGRYIVFTSDRAGKAAVFLVPLHTDTDNA